MRKSSKKLIALTSAVVLTIGTLAGCSSNKNDNSSSNLTPTTGASNTVTNAPAATQVPAKEVDLTFPCIWVGTDSKATVFGQMVNDFNTEYQGKYHINIEEQTDYNAYQDKIRTEVSAGQAPDIFTVKTFADVQLFAQSGNLMDLTSMFANDSDLSGRFIQGALDSAKTNGALYAMPYENGVIPMMYNKRLLDAAGVTALPTSFDELFAACDKLKTSGVFPLCQMTGDNAWTSMLWYSYAVAACGGSNVYANGLSDPAFVKAAEILRKMFNYTSSDAVGAKATDVNGHFFNERAAIYTNGSWILGRIKTEGVAGLYDNLEISGGLSDGGNNGGAYIDAVQAYICVGKQTDPSKTEAVNAFLKFITDPAKVLDLANSSGSLFTINIDASKITNPVQAQIIQQNAEAPFTIGNFAALEPTAVANAFPAALEQLVLDQVTPDGFVALLQQAAQE